MLLSKPKITSITFKQIRLSYYFIIDPHSSQFSYINIFQLAILFYVKETIHKKYTVM